MKTRRLFHINELGSFFVVRAKKTLKYQHVRWKRRMKKNVLSDSIIRLTIYKSSHDYPAVLRRIEYFDEEQNRIFVYLTNALSLDALDVANLYKNRWQIELFFYDKHIIMQSRHQSDIDFQYVNHFTCRFNFT